MSESRKRKKSNMSKEADNSLLEPAAQDSQQQETQNADSTAGAAVSVEPASKRKEEKEPAVGKEAPLPQVTDQAPSTESEATEPEHTEPLAEQFEADIEEHPDISQKSASVISIVDDLRRELDTTCEIKEALEADLSAARKELREMSSARSELEARVELLQEQANLAEQLREDVAFAEEERNTTARLLEETKAQLEELAEERDSLAREIAEAHKSIEKLQRDKVDLETKISLLEDKVTEMNRLRDELQKMAEAHRQLDASAHDLTTRLEASGASNDVLESDLAAAREEGANLQEKLAIANESLREMRAESEEQKTENRDVRDANLRLGQELKMLTNRYEAAAENLEAHKKALAKIHAAALASGRARKRRAQPPQEQSTID